MAVADSVQNIGTDNIQAGAVTNAKLANDSITINGSDTALGTSVTVGVPTTRNLIINGAMEVAQRGTSHTTAAQTYLLDRFYTYCAASGKTISQTSNAPDGFRKSIKLQRDNGSSATNPVYLSQPCESSACVGFAGQTITLSFYARKGANFSPTSDYINVAVYSGTGTDQSMMAGLTGSTAVIGAVNQAITADWVRYTFTSGSAVPTNSNQLVFQILHSPTGTAGANDWYEITGIQIEIGSSATDFVHEPFADTLFKCKRFYQKSFDYETAPFHTGYVAGHSEAGGGTGSVITATEYVTVTRYERGLRVDPTIVYYRAQGGGLSDGEWAYWDGADNLDTSGSPSAATTQIVLRTAVPFASGGKTTGRAGITQGNYTADSEL